MKLYDNDAYREDFMALVYDLLHSDGTNDRANQIIDAFDMAPTVEADPLFPNFPLTLDELREMDGEPVWITPSSFWALVIARPGERVKLISNDGEVVFADKEIELVGPVYRHKPEKGAEHGKQS